MNPDTRLIYALAIALLMWSPAALATATGTIEVWTGGTIFLGALAFAWVGTGVVSSITESYRRGNERIEEAKREIERLEERHARAERRRKDDQEAAAAAEAEAS